MAAESVKQEVCNWLTKDVGNLILKYCSRFDWMDMPATERLKCYAACFAVTDDERVFVGSPFGILEFPINKIETEHGIRAMAFCSRQNRLFVATQTVQVLERTANVDVSIMAQMASALAVDNNELFVTDRDSNVVSVVDSFNHVDRVLIPTHTILGKRLQIRCSSNSIAVVSDVIYMIYNDTVVVLDRHNGHICQEFSRRNLHGPKYLVVFHDIVYVCGRPGQGIATFTLRGKFIRYIPLKTNVVRFTIVADDVMCVNQKDCSIQYNRF